MAKFIVAKGRQFFYSSPPGIGSRDPEADASAAAKCRMYGEGEIVDLPDVRGKPQTVGDNLRRLSADELKLTPSALKAREIGPGEQTLEEPSAAAA